MAGMGMQACYACTYSRLTLCVCMWVRVHGLGVNGPSPAAHILTKQAHTSYDKTSTMCGVGVPVRVRVRERGLAEWRDDALTPAPGTIPLLRMGIG